MPDTNFCEDWTLFGLRSRRTTGVEGWSELSELMSGVCVCV